MDMEAPADNFLNNFIFYIMNKKQVIFWAVLAAIVVALVCFLKYNPLYATVEVIAAFCIGFCGEWIVDTIYNKWIKDATTSDNDNTTEDGTES